MPVKKVRHYDENQGRNPFDLREWDDRNRPSSPSSLIHENNSSRTKTGVLRRSTHAKRIGIVERDVTCTRPRQGVYSNNISTQGILVLYWKKDSRRLVKNASREVQRNMKRMIIVVTAITAIAAIAITTISVPDRFE